MLDADLLTETAQRLTQFSGEYHGEIPLKLHTHELDRGGAPGWDPRFASWVSRGGSRRPDMGQPEPDRVRVTRAMRSLRKVAPREHDVVYRALVIGNSPEQIQVWLNGRAIAGGHPERYTLKDTVVLLVSGIDKIAHWY